MFDLGLIVRVDGVAKDVLISLDEGGDGRALYVALGSTVALSPDTHTLVVDRTGDAIPLDEALDAIGVRWGDTLSTVAVPAPTVGGVSPLYLEQIEGPAVGERLPLADGDHVIGRGRRVGVVEITDPAMSRSHASIAVAGDAVTVTDTKSRNGTFLDDRKISGPTPVALGQSLTFGDYVYRLGGGVVSVPPHLAYRHGLLQFNRQPRAHDAEPPHAFTLDTPPASPAKRRLPMASAIAPIVISGVMVLSIKGHPLYYLLVAGLSPVVMVFNNLDDRRAGRKQFTVDAEAYRRRIDSLRGEITAAVTARGTWCERRWPRYANLVAFVRFSDPKLWERRPHDSDFADVRIGTSRGPSGIDIKYQKGGDDSLDALAGSVRALADDAHDGPSVIHLRSVGAVGLAGPQLLMTAHAKWLLAQLVSQQSHRDLAVAVIAPGGETTWGSAKWLPHVRSIDASVPSLAFTDQAAIELFDRLRDLAATRRTIRDESYGGSASALPHIVVFVQPPVPISRRMISEFLADLSSVGISVIWIATSRGELPGECSSVVESDSAGTDVSFWETGEEQRAHSASIEVVTDAEFELIATGIAPLRDTTAGTSGGPVPARVELVQLLGIEELTEDLVIERWSEQRPTIAATVGHDGEGPYEVDFTLDGPHGLVAGMSGSGKSEFLQTAIASLALTHPPSRVNFILVDYKGGSAFKSCRYLPHTVGFVTDLDHSMAERAIRSLEAETSRREHEIVVVGGAKDLLELRVRKQEDAIPDLFVIVDEFAFLVRDLPDLVDRLVDIAQRGRSLGIHLILGTQRPSGVVSPHIQGNTNLRVALHTASTSDSMDVIDRPDAAAIQARQVGRAMFRTGDGEIHEVQSAYVGGDSAAATIDTASARTFVVSSNERRAATIASASPADFVTDLDRIVAATQGAMERLDLAAPREPWLPPLPTRISLDELDPLEGGGLRAAVGVEDRPDNQDQRTWAIDLTMSSNQLILGGPGTGKTSMLRSTALALAAAHDPRDLFIYGFDFGSDGLRVLEGLAHWGGTASSSDEARVHRLLALLSDFVADRREILASSHVATPAEYRSVVGEPMAEVVVLIDNLAAFLAALDPHGAVSKVPELQRLIADGRGAGIHFVMTADRPGSVPSAIASAVAGQFVLPLANETDYGMLGRGDLAKLASNTPGRGLTRERTIVQIALPGDIEDGSTEAERARRAVETIAAEAEPFDVPQLRVLQAHHAATDHPVPVTSTAIPFALDERFSVATVDLVSDPLFLVVGLNGSGRTVALGRIVSGLREVYADAPSYFIGARPSSLSRSKGWTATASNIDDAPAVLSTVLELARARIDLGPAEPLVLVLDDADDFAELSSSATGMIESIQKIARDAFVIVLAAVTTPRAQRTFSSWLGAMRTNRHGMHLAASFETQDIFRGRLPAAADVDPPAGRGYLFTSNGSRLVQVLE